MGAPSETYVDPSIAGNSGSGTSGDPYGDLQYALNTMTRDSTNGDRINIKSGTDEVLTAALSLTSYGTPTNAAPLIMQGYTSTAGDGGVGGISGNGSYSMFAVATLDYIHLCNLHMHNTGSAHIINLDNSISVVKCELDNTTGVGITADNDCVIVGNYVHNCGSNGIDVGLYGFVAWNYLKNGTNKFTYAIGRTGGSARTIMRNIIDLGSSSSSDGILCTNQDVVDSNSIYSPSGTGQGISVHATNRYLFAVTNNVIDGFGGTGGVGIDLGTSGTIVYYYGGNSVRSATTIENAPGNKAVFSDGTAVETLSSDPFTTPGSNDFKPLDVGALKQGAVPDILGVEEGTNTNYLWRGAVEPEEPTGGGGGGTTVPQGLHPIADGVNA